MACGDLLFLLPKTVVDSKQPGPNISLCPRVSPQGIGCLTRLRTRPVWKRSSWVIKGPKKFQPKRSAPTSLIHKRKGSIFGQRPELHGWARSGVQKNLLDVWGKPKPWELLKDDITQSSCKLGRCIGRWIISYVLRWPTKGLPVSRVWHKIRWSSAKSSIQCFDCPTKLMISAECEMRQWSLVKKWRSLFYDVLQ